MWCVLYNWIFYYPHIKTKLSVTTNRVTLHLTNFNNVFVVNVMVFIIGIKCMKAYQNFMVCGRPVWLCGQYVKIFILIFIVVLWKPYYSTKNRNFIFMQHGNVFCRTSLYVPTPSLENDLQFFMWTNIYIYIIGRKWLN